VYFLYLQLYPASKPYIDASHLQTYFLERYKNMLYHGYFRLQVKMLVLYVI